MDAPALLAFGVIVALALLVVVGQSLARQVQSTVAWQATAIAGASLILGLPLGLLAGRWAWILLTDQVAIVPAPVISPLLLLAVPAVSLLANAIAAVPARAAAHRHPLNRIVQDQDQSERFRVSPGLEQTLPGRRA